MSLNDKRKAEMTWAKGLTYLQDYPRAADNGDEQLRLARGDRKGLCWLAIGLALTAPVVKAVTSEAFTEKVQAIASRIIDGPDRPGDFSNTTYVVSSDPSAPR